MVCLVLGFFQSFAWWLGIGYLMLWTLLLMWASIVIQSGYFIQSVNRFDNAAGKVFLTFDDGPVIQTQKILDLCKKYKVSVSFFCVGEKILKYPSLVQRIVNEGHTLGNHSFSHSFGFPLKGVSVLRKEIRRTQDIIREITGRQTFFFRPPYGVTNPLVAAAVKPFNLKVIGWSVRSFDTGTTTKSRVLKRVAGSISTGSILLFHDTVPYIAELFEEVIEICRAKGLEPVALHQHVNTDE
jgi:peptidoglycan/xylan/chitin deacetylase (PgdA/CDA1 family)